MALCAVSGMLNGVFGLAKTCMLQRGRPSRLLIAPRKPRKMGPSFSESVKDFTNELTLVYASGETAILR